eukprot:gnl/TRDRNA2_/TRDRNA2_61814_c0_seq1.p1 gnl/TRDRNA2_/TRDRNA2_61814_c0~~gnl/TRDRNA2_/TRDRNA2_61814_c0_seq1.p1  ORF type:complete len:329 (-),score=70.59 gnl/TRDRNA2_/TRDRNA2_61814_c0_seq1:3-890(-)
MEDDMEEQTGWDENRDADSMEDAHVHDDGSEAMAVIVAQYRRAVHIAKQRLSTRYAEVARELTDATFQEATEKKAKMEESLDTDDMEDMHVHKEAAEMSEIAERYRRSINEQKRMRASRHRDVNEALDELDASFQAPVTNSGASGEGNAVNVENTALQSCSHSPRRRMAKTGFTRDGKCEYVANDDQGSHHICIEMRSDFCTETGQSNWCTGTAPCHDDANSQCPIVNWCVCQWAFATYLQEHVANGGTCSDINVHCDATNMQAAIAYSGMSDTKHVNAFNCIKAHCNVPNPLPR